MAINYFWKEHPIVQQILGFKPGTNERLELAKSMLEEEKEKNPLTFNCLCGKCGEILKCEHFEGESHIASLCAECAGEML